jgi:hypothetical protein
MSMHKEDWIKLALTPVPLFVVGVVLSMAVGLGLLALFT